MSQINDDRFGVSRRNLLRFAGGAGALLAAAGSTTSAWAAQTGTTTTQTEESKSQNSAPMAASDNQVALREAMRMLWSYHMQYTYMTVDAFFHNQAALQPTLDRLLQDQKDTGAAFVPYYGQEVGDKLGNLLTTHIELAVPVLKAAQANNQTALDKALADWYANAKVIADFLSTLNPKNWPTSATEPIMKTHIAQTTTYAVDLLKGDYAKSIKDYDAAYAHMMMLADVLTGGIIAQYPNKF